MKKLTAVTVNARGKKQTVFVVLPAATNGEIVISKNELYSIVGFALGIKVEPGITIAYG